MTAAKLRQAVFRKPFRPLRMQLHAGDPVEVRHPEFIAITDSWVLVGQDPAPPVVFEAEMVVSIEYLDGSRAKG
ncbi:MAG: hypothetical protein HY720_13845 [Planctomycetes bacterium]|nr:hypothetical protein [Planctomycetota bacterium]